MNKFIGNLMRYGFKIEDKKSFYKVSKRGAVLIFDKKAPETKLEIKRFEINKNRALKLIRTR